jgi:hypothetical protein
VAPVKRRGALGWLKLAAAGVVALVVVIGITMSINRYRAPASAPPEALERIAQKNREAAAIAAASQRAESAASTNAVENLAETQQRGAPAANTAAEARDDRSAPPGNAS